MQLQFLLDRQLLEEFPIPEEVEEHRAIIGEADVPTIQPERCLIWLKLTKPAEEYRNRKELLFPLTSCAGRRIYVSAKPYIPITKMTLTFVSTPPQADSNAIGRVTESDIKQLQELEIGTAQAWYYPAEKALVLWECYLHQRYRQQDLLTDSLAASVWQGFEQELLKLEPLRDAERIYTTYEDIYERPVWEQFLTVKDYRKVEKVTFVKEPKKWSQDGVHNSNFMTRNVKTREQFYTMLIKELVDEVLNYWKNNK